MSEYHMPLSSVFKLRVPAGLELLEARRNRLAPDINRVSYLDRCIIAARNRCRADLEARFTIVPA